ncbi:hypothetical protein QUA20_29485 [Microcoleus sp. Pol7_A1]|nr:hypothetical protein [Microcoleus asticus]
MNNLDRWSIADLILHPVLILTLAILSAPAFLLTRTCDIDTLAQI